MLLRVFLVRPSRNLLRKFGVESRRNAQRGFSRPGEPDFLEPRSPRNASESESLACCLTQDIGYGRRVLPSVGARALTMGWECAQPDDYDDPGAEAEWGCLWAGWSKTPSATPARRIAILMIYDGWGCGCNRRAYRLQTQGRAGQFLRKETS